MSDSRVSDLFKQHQITQTKTFTRWMNSHLRKRHLEVFDLFKDLHDGIMLMQLLEIITGEDLGKPTKGTMRLHNVTNVNTSLAFVQQHARLESIGGEDIVDGNRTLILGLIWTIILRLQIEQMVMVDEEDEDQDRNQKRSNKEMILHWCKKITGDYPGLNIKDFSNSWRDGMGFNAIIHAHRPDIIDIKSLKPDEPIKNLNNAFDVAHKELGVEKILDAQDIALANPDEKSILTYLASLYQSLGHLKRPDPKLIRDNDATKGKYEALASELMKWILAKVPELDGRQFPNSIDGIKKLKMDFGVYRTKEKPPRHDQRMELARMHFALQSGMKMLRMPKYIPPAGLRLTDIETQWLKLEQAELKRQEALDLELLRQLRIWYLTQKFETKSKLCETFLLEMMKVARSNEDPGQLITTLEELKPLVNKNEALADHIVKKQSKIQDLTKIADDLESERFSDHVAIRTKEKEFKTEWSDLFDLMSKKKTDLQSLFAYVEITCKVKAVEQSIREMKDNFRTSLIGYDILAVEELLIQHAEFESQVAVLGESYEDISAQTKTFINSTHTETSFLQKKIKEVKVEYQTLLHMVGERRKKLEEAKVIFQLQFDIEEEKLWVQEHILLCEEEVVSKDITTITSIQQRYLVFEGEMPARRAKAEMLIKSSGQLSTSSLKQAREVSEAGRKLKLQWSLMEQQATQRKKLLERAVLACSFYASANETESWIKEKVTLCQSKDYGDNVDESLLQQHAKLEAEIKDFESTMKTLNAQGNKLIQSGSSAKTPQRKPNRASNSSSSSSSSDSSDEEKENSNKVKNKENKKHKMKRMLSIEAPNAIAERLQFINSSFRQLCELSQKHYLYLQESIKAYSYFKECDDFEAWLKNKERLLKRERSDDLEVNRRWLEKIVADLNQAGERLVIVDKHVQNFSASGHSQLEKIKLRKAQLYEQWALINRLRQQKEQNLQAAANVEEFLRVCSEVKDWMEMKMEKIGDGELDRDLKTVQSLQRSLGQLERELSPVEEKLGHVNLMAESVKISYPNDSKVVTERQQDVQNYWVNLNNKLRKRKTTLEQSVSFIIFLNTIKSLQTWIHDLKRTISSEISGDDVTLTKHQLTTHQELRQDLQALHKELTDLKKFGEKLIKKNSYGKEVKEKLQILEGEEEAVQRAWMEKLSLLQQLSDLTTFSREAEYMNVVARSSEAFLKNQDLGETLSAAEILWKRHTEFENVLTAQDERLNKFVEIADKLLKANHPESKYITEKRDKVRERWIAIRDGNQARKEILRDSVEYQTFKADALELEDWIVDKRKIVDNESYKNLLYIERKLQTHECLEKEIELNESKLQQLIKIGQKLLDAKHYQSDNIRQLMSNLNENWKELCTKAHEKNLLLKQAEKQAKYNEEMEEVMKKLNKINNMLTVVEEVAPDLRTCVILINKQQSFEKEIAYLEKIIIELLSTAQKMVEEGHFNRENIQTSCTSSRATLDEAKDLSIQRRELLEASLNWHKFSGNMDLVLQLISEYNRLASDKELGDNLSEVQLLKAKHMKLTLEVNNHQGKIDEVIKKGEKLIAEKHPQSEMIEFRLKDLKNLWSGLLEILEDRARTLEQNLKTQYYLTEVKDLESMIEGTKGDLQDSTDNGRGRKRNRSHSSSRDSSRSSSKRHGKHRGKGNSKNRSRSHSKSSSESRSRSRSSSKSRSSRSSSKSSGGNRNRNRNKSHSKSRSRSRSKSQDKNRNRSRSHSKNRSRSGSSSSSGSGDESKRKTVVAIAEAEPEVLVAKHKALDNDIIKYSDAVAKLAILAEHMVKENHPDAKQIQDRQQDLNKKLKDLQSLSDEHHKRVQHSLALQQYLQEVEDLEQWIIEHKQTPAHQDLDQGYEQIVALQVRFDYLKQRVTSGSARFNHCEQLAKKILAEDMPYAARVESRQSELRLSWKNLLDHIEGTARELQEAGEIHLFLRDVGDIISRIKEKEKLIGKDIGQDLATIKIQQLMLERLERDLGVLGIQVQNHLNTSDKLKTAYQGSKTLEQVTHHETLLQESWDNLQKRISKRKEQLAAAAERKHFMIDSHNLLDWTNDVSATFKEKEKPHNVEEVIALKANQEQLKADLEARKDVFSKVMETGRHIVGDAKDPSDHESSSESSSESDDSDSEYDEAPSFLKIKDEIEELSTRWTQLSDEVDNRVRGLEEVNYFLEFGAKARRILDTIRIKIFVLERHENDAETLLEAYVSDSHKNYDLETIQDLLRRHQVFEGEMDKTDKEIDKVTEEAKELTDKYPDAKDQLSSRLTVLTEAFAELKDKSKQRRDKLHQAEKVQDYFDNYKELMALLNETLGKITAPDLPKDVPGAEFVIIRHKEYKAQLDTRKNDFEDFEKRGMALCNEGHFMKAEIERKIENLLARGALLVETWKARYTIYKCNLDVRIYLRDAKDFESWLERGEIYLEKEHLGQSIEEVEELIRRHQFFLDTIEAHNNALENVKRLTMIEDNFKAQKRYETTFRKENSSNDKEMAIKMEEGIKNLEKEEGNRKKKKKSESKENATNIITKTKKKVVFKTETNGIMTQENVDPIPAPNEENVGTKTERRSSSSSSSDDENGFLDASDDYISFQKRYASSSEDSGSEEETENKSEKKKNKDKCVVM